MFLKKKSICNLHKNIQLRKKQQMLVELQIKSEVPLPQKKMSTLR